MREYNSSNVKSPKAGVSVGAGVTVGILEPGLGVDVGVGVRVGVGVLVFSGVGVTDGVKLANTAAVGTLTTLGSRLPIQADKLNIPNKNKVKKNRFFNRGAYCAGMMST